MWDYNGSIFSHSYCWTPSTYLSPSPAQCPNTTFKKLYNYVGWVCGQSGCESGKGENADNCPQDFATPPASSCDIQQGTYRVNGGSAKPLYTVNMPPNVNGPGIGVTLPSCSAGYSWTLTSGSCPGWSTGGSGATMNCYLSSGSASWQVRNPSGQTRSITFVR